jgi:hypothetical protein
MMSQGENCLLKMPIFSGKVVDFRLNYSILKENDKNTISGRSRGALHIGSQGED